MRTLFVILISLVSVSLYGQAPGLIEGKVTDAKGSALAGVNVYVEGLKAGTTTGVSGYFKLEILPGHYQVVFSSIGFTSISKSVDVYSSQSSAVTAQLDENLYELPAVIIERETMTGGSLFLNDVPGSSHYINPRELQKFNYTDINRILRNIPGVNLQEEDGFGLRPNIGMRGTGVERSSKITLMEDAILMAPAPYTAPAAYYFPTSGRMQGVEVRKGSSQIKYGPYTTGGALNFISTPIPQDLSVRVNLTGGNFGRRTLHASVGQSFQYGGFLVETFQNSADGFKKLDNGGSTGFNNEDYILKFRLNTDKDARVYQALTLKLGQTTGDADETYLGLTQVDFDATPNRRYYASQLDNIQTEHHQYSLKYNVIPAKFMDVSIVAYRNDFKRNWYKLDQVKYASNTKVNISSVLDKPDQYPDEYALLTGNTSPNDDALYVRNNNREYYSKGVQGIIGFNFVSGKLKHDIETGFRFHQDEEDRFQWDDVYKMETGVMELTRKGTPGSESNRVSRADAFATYIQYSLQIGKFMALPGLRYEKMKFGRSDYGKFDPDRIGTSLSTSENKIDVVIPGLGLEYSFTSSVLGFVGVHRGFAPPGATAGTEPEKSVNYEIGTRINKPNFRSQFVGFFNDYENLLGSDLAAAGGGGSGDQFNAGKALTYGAEVEMGSDFAVGTTGKIHFPVSIAYTFTKGEFESSFVAANEDWGKVQAGDELPYLATHQVTVNAGAQLSDVAINVSSKYNSAMRTSPGTGEIPDNVKIDSNFIIDVSVNYQATRYLSFFGSVTNIFDEAYVVARRPAGLRPGMPRSFLFGVKVNF